MKCGGDSCVEGESQDGCTYIEAYNFDSDALNDDGSCTFPCTGDMNGDNQKNVVDIVILVDNILNSVFCP